MKWKIIVLLLLCGCIIVDAHDWSMYQQNPQHTGYSPFSIPESLTEAWIYQEYGKLRAYFVVSDEKLFVVQDFSLSALDINTGFVLWNKSLLGNFASVPAVAHNKIYVSASGALLCYNADTGDIIWNYEVQLLDIRSFPIVIDGKVFVGGGDTNHPSTWNQEIKEALERAEEYARKVLCLNAETGEHVWEFYAQSTTPYSPAYLDNKIYINDGFRNIYCLDVRTGKLIWEKKLEWTTFSSLSLNKKRIFVGTSNGIACLDSKTGDVVWHFDCGESVFETPAVAYSKVFFGTPHGIFYCVNAETGKLIWKIETKNRISTEAVVADRKVVFGTGDGIVYIVQTESGKICESLQLGERGITALALSDGKLFVGEENGRITCFEGSNTKKSMNIVVGSVIGLLLISCCLIKDEKMKRFTYCKLHYLFICAKNFQTTPKKPKNI
jgi:outer membrane protein assembly factor BamB